jgi:hypothetical protein
MFRAASPRAETSKDFRYRVRRGREAEGELGWSAGGREQLHEEQQIQSLGCSMYTSIALMAWDYDDAYMQACMLSSARFNE